MVEYIFYSMSQKAVGDDEMTELERKVVHHRIRRIDEQEEYTVEEALDKLD